MSPGSAQVILIGEGYLGHEQVKWLPNVEQYDSYQSVFTRQIKEAPLFIVWTNNTIIWKKERKRKQGFVLKLLGIFLH